jgi:hypothetical protein
MSCDRVRRQIREVGYSRLQRFAGALAGVGVGVVLDGLGILFPEQGGSGLAVLTGAALVSVAVLLWVWANRWLKRLV